MCVGGVRAWKDEGEMDVCAFDHQYSIMHLSFAVCVCVCERSTYPPAKEMFWR